MSPQVIVVANRVLRAAHTFILLQQHQHPISSKGAAAAAVWLVELDWFGWRQLATHPAGKERDSPHAQEKCSSICKH
jgi:hypothetical protein